MSKIGKRPIHLPSGVTVEVNGSDVVVRGPKGELKHTMVGSISAQVNTEDNTLLVETTGTAKGTKAFHGLARSIINNMVEGVSKGFVRRLSLVGTGYRVAQKGKALTLTVGYSHPVEVAPVSGIDFAVEGNTTIIVSGIDKHLVGQVSANIRRVRPPEPYKGKGIRYEDEQVRRKQGKTVGK